MIVDPTGPYAVNGASAMARAVDDEIIPAFFGTAKTGENGTTDETFDSAYQVGVDVGGTASSLNTAKLQSAVRLLISAHKGEVTEPIYGAISSWEHDALLKEVQVTSRDFNGGDAVLEAGRVKRFLGVNFILTERLEIASGNRELPIWVPTGMHLGIWEDMIAKVDQRADKSYAWQVYLAETIGATRLQQGKVIRVLVNDQI